MTQSSKNIKLIFAEALEKQTSGERTAYLDEACKNDTELLRKVEALLKAYEEADDVPDGPIIDLGPTMDDMTLTEHPGTVIDKYKLLEKIGEGGMAVVYMVEQHKPICRKVALKIIKLGMDTKQVIARFEAERQALAMMDHPNIAKVLDAGATETGRPYFVMELVTGVSITEYCDKNNLNTKERLSLFIQVCHAVQHAHQKGIIHRDIKPSNIMVTRHEGKPVPKVIDFGIAKAINQRLTEKTLFTRYAHVIGTPAYMSPEQADLGDMDVDTRTDIYSLGVLLYELLTGTPPFSEEQLRQVGYLEMQRIIREKEPAKPSTKLSTLGETLTNIAKHRGCTPDLLRKAVRGDLDWIVMKSLEKDRIRRYETANSLAEDIQRHLEHEPILARGPSTTYHLQKFIHRHCYQILGALAIAVVAGLVIAILSMWNKDRLQLAEAESIRHRSILSQAREQYAKAERDAAIEAIKPVLDSRHVGPEARLLYAGILVDNRKFDEAVTILSGLVDESPEIAGAAHSLLARILWENGSPTAEQLKEIDEHRRKAETLLPETPEAYFLRAMTAITVKEQLASLDRALQLDPGHYESRRLRAYTYYASRKYEKMKDDALVMTILRPKDPLGYSLRAIAWRELGRYQEAITDFDIAMVLVSRDDPQYIDLSTQRCETLLRMGDYEQVIASARECLTLSPDKTVFQYYIFSAMTALGNYEEAEALFQQIISPGHQARRKFRDWCAKYIFDTLESKQPWHPADREPSGAAFLPMLEAEETYRDFSTKGRRLTTNGFGAGWSPDGKKLAFSLGVLGYSGVAIYDPATKETELLIVPGKDPKWSPDGKYIAFVRDCQLLRLEELATAEREHQQRSTKNEEVWVMNADGTEPRYLAQGSWPTWGRDSEHLYYLSRGGGMFCSVSVNEPRTEPKRILKCSNSIPSVSPDNKNVSFFQGRLLKVVDLASQTPIGECAVPVMSWGVTDWSPTCQEVCLGGGAKGEQPGLWVYNLNRKELLQVLDGQIMSACWSAQATEMAVCINSPYIEIWVMDLDPNVPTIEALRLGRTIDEYYHQMIRLLTRRIVADPMDAYAYSDRAYCYDYLKEREKAVADMRRWSAILSGNSESQFDKSANLRRVINLPFNCELVFSAERPKNKIPVISVAFGQKGRCNMKLFKIPIFVMSLFGLSVFSCLDTQTAYADFTFGEPVNLKSIIPVFDPVYDDIGCLSSDGLEMYIVSNRPGGLGHYDLWVLKRASVDDDWGQAANLGPAVNSPQEDSFPCISADGLTLYFSGGRSGGHGSYDLYMTTRPTKNSPWSQAMNMGTPINSSAGEGCPWISQDGLELYFESWRPGGYGQGDIYVARRASENDPWGQPENLGATVNSAYSEESLFLSPDGLLLFFTDTWTGQPRPGGYGSQDIWMTGRMSLSDPWQQPVNMGPKFNGSAYDYNPRITPDGRTFYFSTALTLDPSTYVHYQVSILPIVDFNGDGNIDTEDLLIMIAYWGTDEPLCDIAPYAWGDGVVDIEDLIVFMEYWEKENMPELTEDIE